MARFNPYLNFPGNTEEAFTFYQSVFGGELVGLQRFNDTPEAANVPPEDGHKIMHIALPIGPDTVLMATDALESRGHTLVVGNNFSLSISTDSPEEADHLFGGLSEGGLPTMPMSKTFWGAYFGMVTDKFGIQWMISYDENYVNPN
ncbi:VOC family protein [Larkinella bovis]|uniref:VOC family protein n=1 Tax=Larkinella bovis TaxID=683041 RepID=A0ABW0I7R4_9BACT